MIHLQQYYRDSDGALIFVDLQKFKISKDRQCIISSAKDLIQDLERYTTGTKIPCVLVGTKVIACIHDKIMIAISNVLCVIIINYNIQQTKLQLHSHYNHNIVWVCMDVILDNLEFYFKFVHIRTVHFQLHKVIHLHYWDIKHAVIIGKDVTYI